MRFKEIWDKSWIRSVEEKKTNLRNRVLRILGVILSKVLLKTSITANQVSILSSVAIIISCVLFGFGKYYLSLLAVIILYFGEVLDYADGTIARCRGTVTKLQSSFLCKIYHPTMYGLIFVSLGVGLYVQTKNVSFLIMGCVSGLLQQTTIYLLELKNSIILENHEDQYKSYKNISKMFVDTTKKNILKIFSIPIDYLYIIILIAILINGMVLLLYTFTTYLVIRLVVFTAVIYKTFRKMEIIK